MIKTFDKNKLRHLTLDEFVKEYSLKMEKHGKAVFESVKLGEQLKALPSLKSIIFKRSFLAYQKFGNKYYSTGNGFDPRKNGLSPGEINALYGIHCDKIPNNFYTDELRKEQEGKIYEGIVFEDCGFGCTGFFDALFKDIIFDDCQLLSNCKMVDCTFENLQIINSPEFAEFSQGWPPLLRCKFKNSKISGPSMCNSDVYGDCRLEGITFS